MTTRYLINVAELHLRQQANASSPILLTMKKNQVVTLLEGGIDDHWWKIQINRGTKTLIGYVSQHYLIKDMSSTSSSNNDKPITTPHSGSHSGQIEITHQSLARLCPKANPTIMKSVLSVINELFSKTGINKNSLRVSQFLAQVATESAGLNAGNEKLNYHALRLRQVWPRHFNKKNSAEYAHNPEKLANYIYANRLGNGNCASGDGWRFRGRGLLQLTGRDNYAHYGKLTGMDLVDNPDQAADPAIALKIAVKYWMAKDLNTWADKIHTHPISSKDSSIIHITRAINGGTNGLEDRVKYFKTGYAIWG